MAWGATHQHVEPGLGDGVGRGDLPEVRADAPERAGHVNDRLLAAPRDERDEGLRDERGADDVRPEARRQVLRPAHERAVEPARHLH